MSKQPSTKNLTDKGNAYGKLSKNKTPLRMKVKY